MMKESLRTPLMARHTELTTHRTAFAYGELSTIPLTKDDIGEKVPTMVPGTS